MPSWLEVTLAILAPAAFLGGWFIHQFLFRQALDSGFFGHEPTLQRGKPETPPILRTPAPSEREDGSRRAGEVAGLVDDGHA